MAGTVAVIKDCSAAIKSDYKAGKINKKEMKSRLDFCSYSGFNGEEWKKVTMTPRCITLPCGEIVTWFNPATGVTITDAEFNAKINENAANGGANVVLPTFEIPLISIVAPLVCLLVAVYIAYKRDSKLLGWIGWIFLGSLIGGAVSQTAYVVANRKAIEKQITK